MRVLFLVPTKKYFYVKARIYEQQSDIKPKNAIEDSSQPGNKSLFADLLNV